MSVRVRVRACVCVRACVLRVRAACACVLRVCAACLCLGVPEAGGGPEYGDM